MRIRERDAPGNESLLASRGPCPRFDLADRSDRCRAYELVFARHTGRHRIGRRRRPAGRRVARPDPADRTAPSMAKPDRPYPHETRRNIMSDLQRDLHALAHLVGQPTRIDPARSRDTGSASAPRPSNESTASPTTDTRTAPPTQQPPAATSRPGRTSYSTITDRATTNHGRNPS